MKISISKRKDIIVLLLKFRKHIKIEKIYTNFLIIWIYFLLYELKN